MPTTRSTRSATAASRAKTGKSKSPRESPPRMNASPSPKRKAVKDEDEPETPPLKRSKSEDVEIKTLKGNASTNRTGGSEGLNAKPGEMPSDRFLSSMGTKDNLERTHGVLESGEIYFVYRPRVMVDEAASLGDVARLHMLLIPSNKKASAGITPHRLVLVGRKHLPRAKSGRPDVMWGEVLEVGDDMTQLKERLGPYEYQTKTRGDRHVGAARVAGRGHYVLNCSPDNPAPKGSKNMSAVYKTYFAYVLSTPHTLGEVQADFNIEESAVMILQVKDPNAPSNNPAVRTTPRNHKPKYPAALMKLFNTKFVPANPTSLLDFPGAEVLMIPSTHSVEEIIDEKVTEKELSSLKKEDDAADSEGMEAAKTALKGLGLLELATPAIEGHWA